MPLAGSHTLCRETRSKAAMRMYSFLNDLANLAGSLPFLHQIEATKKTCSFLQPVDACLTISSFPYYFELS